MMKTFLLSFLVLLVATVQGEPAQTRFLRRLDATGISDDVCIALGSTCDEENDDCCSVDGTCTFESYTPKCRQFFRLGGDCDITPLNECCQAIMVCKTCKSETKKCVQDEDCCDDLDCVYSSKAAGSFGTCQPDNSLDGDNDNMDGVTGDSKD
ncbi:hypothetical protein MPSEU_000170100 [Mayamaea pseudoterrestris]|nr:hypothetical protein MPSEU_000170100 [Mayamaea pseudoterrestris]